MNKYSLILFSVVLVFLAGCATAAPVGLKSVNNETTVINQDFIRAVDMGLIDGAYTVHKFGANDNVGTSLIPISLSGNYRTPQSATTLEILSDDIDDTLLGAGARSVRVIGLNESGDEVSVDVNMSGTTPVIISQDFLRVYRVVVLTSGTYATQTAGSHQGTIEIREQGNGDTWLELNVINGGFGVSQSEIGAYTVPKGYTCYLTSKSITVNSNKFANIYFFQRQNITEQIAPYKAMRLVEKHVGITGALTLKPQGYITSFPELTDIGFLGETASGTSEVSVEFELVCTNNELFPSAMVLE